MIQNHLKIIALFALTTLASANPLITEFMADNKGSITDEDGAYSDWIEVHNPTATAINLNNYTLTDTLSDPAPWRFPVQTLAPGDFIVVWASGKNRTTAGAPLHTSFSLAKGGEYLELALNPLPSGPKTVLQSWNPYPSQAENESYGIQFTTATLVAQGASSKYFVPTSNSVDATWRNTGFVDTSWTTGATGIGFGLMVPGMTVRQVFKNGTIGGLTDTDALLAAPTGSPLILSDTTVIAQTVNYLGNGGDGHYGANAAPPLGTGEHYVMRVTGTFSTTASGYHTFGINSDDGGRIRVNGGTVMTDDTGHGAADNMGNVFLTAGSHTFDVVFFEMTGGDELEFYYAPGIISTWSATMKLVGDTANGGLPVFTTSAGSGGTVVATNVQGAMLNSRTSCYVRTPFTAAGPGAYTAASLKMRYNDGYVAYLNGTKIGEKNAPASPAFNSVATGTRTDTQSLTPEAINVSAYLPGLINGTNVLALHGMNVTAASASFLILPELVVGTANPGAQNVYYDLAKTTPGAINGAYSLLGKVEDTQFSHVRGFYTAPFNLTITSLTSGAEIRYTTDGSTPTASNGTVYTTPIAISATTVIRAAAFKTGFEATDVDTQSYLFLNDVITQSSTGLPPANWPATSGTGQVLDYGMDPDIVNHTDPNLGGATSVKNALTAVSTICVTTDLPNLFNMNGGTTGIYSNPGGRGFAWERPASIELINPPTALNPNGTSEFQLTAGLRIRGGFSRSTDNPKHGWHLFFRDEYGAGKLKYPFFGRHGADEFDQLDLRTAQNYSWSFGGDGNNTFLREESTRLAQRDMGHQHGRLRYFHLYINGIYWGLHNSEERTEASFAETYFGGAKDDYDVVKGEQDSGYITGVTDGNLTAWTDLWNKCKAHLASPTNANYFKLMGLASDGVTPTADPVLLDVDDMIDYLMLTFWTGNLDGTTSAFLSNNHANNWFGIRNRLGTKGGFHFMAHDFEHTFFNVNEDRTGPFTTAGFYDNITYSNPLYMHQDLSANAEYRIRWADRIQKHMFNGGALTQTAWNNRINGIAAIVDQTIIAESARWGDAKVATPLTKANWLTAQAYLTGTYVPQRGAVVLGQLRADNLYPALDAPTITPFGSYQNSGVEAVMSAPGGGTIYYMADGSDPREVGGAVKAGALVYTASTTTDVLLPFSATGWKYLANGTNQGTAWRAVGFNDAAWPTGNAELGYGDAVGEEATTIGFVDVDPGTAGVQKNATTYFRKTFTATNIPQITNLVLRVEYDDAIVVYINGVFAGLAGNISNNPTFDYYTNNAIEDTTLDIQIPSSLLVDGTNTIAAEVHQANNGSSDVSMNLSLTATRSATATPLYLAGNGVRSLKTRANNGTWSALTDATFLLNTEPASTANLAVTEIMYHPANPSVAEINAGFVDADDFEYLELTNIGSKYVDLEGVYLYGPIDFNFTGALTGRTLAPGARVLIVAKKSAFEARYGSALPVAGSYSGNLNNAGETIGIFTPTDGTIRSFAYTDLAPWPTGADGAGYSLVRKLPSANLAADADATNWRTSLTTSGNPGASDASVFTSWKTANSVSDNNADNDGDGLSNALEYALGGSNTTMDAAKAPTVAVTPLTIGATTNNYLVVIYTRRAGADDVTYTVEGSDLSTTWDAAATTIHSIIPGPGGTETVIARSTNPYPEAGVTKKFFRMKAIIAP